MKFRNKNRIMFWLFSTLIVISILLVCLFYIQRNKNIDTFDDLTGQTIIKFYNDNHLGDCGFTCVYFYNIKDYIEQNNVIIHFYVNKEYVSQIKEFIPSKNIVLYENGDTSFDDTKYNQTINAWIGSTSNNVNIFTTSKKKDNKQILNEFLVDFFNEISNTLKIPVKMTEFTYIDPDLLERHDRFQDKYKNVDILIINSDALSTQYSQDVDQWNAYISDLNTKYKIVTTKKVENVNCTMDDKLSIKDIAAISTNATIIMAVNTGPVVGILNSYTLSNVKQMYIFDKNWCYTYDKFQEKDKITDITADEIKYYINL